MSDNLDKVKVEQQLEKAKNKAQEFINNPEKAKTILTEAIKKADSAQGPFEKVWEELQLMFGIIKDWMTAEYKEIPKGSILAILGGLVYFVSPIDVIPDFIPGIGYLDDIFVISLVIGQIRADLQKYKLWKENKIT